MALKSKGQTVITRSQDSKNNRKRREIYMVKENKAAKTRQSYDK